MPKKHMVSVTKAESDGLYRTLKFIHDTFVKHRIPYWVTGGNLLGAIRHGGHIPWDDDGDTCVMLKDVPKLKKLVPYFKRHNYRLEKIDDGGGKDVCIEVKDSCDWFVKPKGKGALGVDIFVMKVKGDRITYANPYWEDADIGGKKCYFLKDYVFPLVPIRYGNFYLYMPNNPVEHLNRCYGTSWNSKAQMLYNHKLGKWINSKPKKMKASEFMHPKPPRDTCSTTIPKVVCPRI